MKHFTLFLLFFSICVYPQNDTIKIVATGDIMLGTVYPKNPEYVPKDCSSLLAPLSDYLLDADITFGNLEGCITDNLKDMKNCKSVDNCYFFAMPLTSGSCLKQGGYNLLSIANNHVNDFGEAGKKSTQNILRVNDIHFAGLLECPMDTFTIKGVRYGFCAFAPNRGTCDVNDIAGAEAIVRHLDSICDIVIVSFHAGAEGDKFEHTPRKMEMFLGERRGNVYEFSHRMIDAGADVLLGHGPHVTRAVEVYKNRFIAYSLGNFCTYSRIKVSGINGLAPLIQLYVNKEGEFLEGRIVPTFQQKYQPPVYDTEGRVIKRIQKLTAEDFPEMKSIIEITDDGWIRMLNR